MTAASIFFNGVLGVFRAAMGMSRWRRSSACGRFEIHQSSSIVTQVPLKHAIEIRIQRRKKKKCLSGGMDRSLVPPNRWTSCRRRPRRCVPSSVCAPHPPIGTIGERIRFLSLHLRTFRFITITGLPSLQLASSLRLVVGNKFFERINLCPPVLAHVAPRKTSWSCCLPGLAR